MSKNPKRTPEISKILENSLRNEKGSKKFLKSLRILKNFSNYERIVPTESLRMLKNLNSWRIWNLLKICFSKQLLLCSEVIDSSSWLSDQTNELYHLPRYWGMSEAQSQSSQHRRLYRDGSWKHLEILHHFSPSLN